MLLVIGDHKEGPLEEREVSVKNIARYSLLSIGRSSSNGSSRTKMFNLGG
ncbi:hypothetical protein CCP2SC5_1090006 [Azospirillaceae bacterium]